MTNGWTECKLGDVLTLQRGFDLPARERQDGHVPIVSSSGVTGFHSVARVRGPGVVTGRYGTLGEVFFVRDDFWPLNTTLYVRDFKGNDLLYLSYFLRTLNFGHQNAAGAVPGVNRNHLHMMVVRVPPLPTQRKIAAILSAYDDLIENNTRRIAILEEMARSLYREWFVHFRFLGYHDVPTVETELGTLPAGWDVGRLDDLVVLQRGFDLPIHQRRQGNIPVYASTGIAGTHDEPKVKGPGVVTGRSGSLGTVNYVRWDFWPLNTTLWVKEFRRSSPLHAFYLLSSLGLEKYNSGAAVPTLNRNDIHGMSIGLPPDEIVCKFDEYASPLIELADCLRGRVAVLRSTRDLLLPKLISGELDVSTLDVTVPEALI